MHGTIDLAGDSHQRAAREQGPVDSARRFRRQPSRTVQDRFVLAVFRPAAPGRPGALLQGQHVRAVLVGDQIQRHHGHRDQPCGVLVGGFARRHHHPRRRAGPAPRELHRHGPAAPLRAAQDRGADVHADASRPARDQHPQAFRRMPRQPADERGVRLGRPGLDRAHHADARRAVRLPLGRPPQADALVRRRDHASRPRRPRRDRGRTPGRADGMRDLFRQALEGAHQPAAEERPVVDDGAQRRHPRHGPEEFPRQSDPADRRRQRHHPQHAVGQHLRAEQESGPVPQAARQSRR